MRYLLLQARDPDDPMRPQEVRCFARALGCAPESITVFDLLTGATPEQWQSFDVVLFGGSGDYSVAAGGPWLDSTMATMRQLVADSKPTFASCWGFQAMARALGGEVITDVERAELGSVEVTLTEAGQADPLFAPLGQRFLAQMGHQDRVTVLPDEAIGLASSAKVSHQAFRIKDKPIYCTQFHPELDRAALIERVEAYPQYVERIAGVSSQEFADSCQETPATDRLLRRFVQSTVG